MTRKRPSALQTPRPYKRQRGRPQRRNEDEDQDSSDEDNRPKHILLEEEKNEEELIEEGGTYVDEIYIPPKITKVAHAGVGERMVIEQIICENFKSYAGVKVLGPFHKNFTSIVGPNGNGKSNIIDAMLFVFGYKSSKIRVKKMSVLIHKSDLVPNAHSCAVTVVFGKIYDSGNPGEDEDEMKILPGTTIKVTRKANASGHSEYILDGEKCKFPDVAKFLKDNGVDIIHNRFLILQGEVESIALMPPKATANGLEGGLMEYLEDIIGTRRYLKCLIKLEERIRELDFDREAKLQQVDLVEQEKRAMAEPVKKAKEYLRDFNSKVRVEQQLLLAKDHEAKKHLQSIEEKKAGIEEVMKGIVDRLDELKSVNDEKEKAFQVAMKTFQGYEAEYKKIKTKLNAHETEYARVNEQLKRSNDQRKKAITDAKKTQAEIERLEDESKTHDEKMTLLEKRKEELVEICKTEEAKVEQQCAKLQKKIDAVIVEKSEADKCLMTHKAKYNEKNNVVETARSDLRIYEDQEHGERQKYDTYKKELDATKERLQQKERDARTSSGNTNVEGLEASLVKAKNDLEAVSVAEKEKSNEFSRLQSQLHEQKEAAEGLKSSDECFKRFTAEQKKGRLAGLYGRLKDLATIPEQFNVAATMATGIWEFFVCDTDDTAQECIQVLKANNLRVENFICLNRIQFLDNRMKQPFQCPTRAKRLFDLFEIKRPELRVAFYKAVSDTLVAENLTIASEIAYGPKRHRVVTLKGDLIDAQGSMTGGGQAISKGKLNSALARNLSNAVSREDIQRMEAAVNRCKAELDEISARRQGLEQETRKLSTDIDRHKMKLKTFETEIQSLKSQIPLKEKRLQQQETKLKECTIDPKLLKEKEKALKAAEKVLEEIAGPYELAEKEATKMKEKLHQLQVVEKGEITRNLNTHKEQQDKVDAEIKKLTVNAKNYKRNHEKNTAKIEQLTKEKAKIEAEMLKLSERKQEIETEAKGVKEKADELEGQCNEAKAAVDQMKEAHDSNRGEENKLAKEKASAETKLTNIMGELKGCKHALKKYADGLAGLKLNDIPEEEVEPLKAYTEEEIEGFRIRELEAKLERRIEKLKGKAPNILILEAYKEKVDQFLKEVEGLDEVTSRRDKVRDAYIKAEAQRLSEFMEGYGIISSKLKEMFRMISMGGDAELSILNKTDPFLAGVELCVRPANKAWKPIKHLSGGEKTLSSLALVFALHHFKPSPFYIMDEIDAALDFKNVSIIANYIKDRTKFTQFIIISLRSNMFELADTLLGVYKVDNMSYSVHLAVNGLLKKMQDKYAANSQPFPLTDDLNRRATPAPPSSQPSDNKENNPDDERQSQSQSQPTHAHLPLLPDLVLDPIREGSLVTSPSPSPSPSPASADPNAMEQDNEVSEVLV